MNSLTPANIPIKEVFNSFKGPWHIERIVDGQIWAVGHADFESNGCNEFYYRERGLLRLSNGKQLCARQSYIYKLDAGSISVYFDERPIRIFHTIAFRMSPSGILEGFGSHQCSDDTYHIKYSFHKNHTFEIHYKIEEPAKDNAKTHPKDTTIVCRYRPNPLRNLYAE